MKLRDHPFSPPEKSWSRIEKPPTFKTPQKNPILATTQMSTKKTDCSLSIQCNTTGQEKGQTTRQTQQSGYISNLRGKKAQIAPPQKIYTHTHIHLLYFDEVPEYKNLICAGRNQNRSLHWMGMGMDNQGALGNFWVMEMF